MRRGAIISCHSSLSFTAEREASLSFTRSRSVLPCCSHSAEVLIGTSHALPSAHTVLNMIRNRPTSSQFLRTEEKKTASFSLLNAVITNPKLESVVLNRSQQRHPPPLFFSLSMALSTVFHSINSPENSPFSHSVLPVLSLPYWSFQLCLFMKVSFSPGII